MTTFEPGQVVLIPFPFTDLTTVKQRPAIVISTSLFNQRNQDVIVVAVTSQNPFELQVDEYALKHTDQISAGLPKPSKVKTGKVVSIEQRLVRKTLGSISPPALDEVMKHVHSNLYRPSSE
jgi:mRNA interferase MazF